MSLTNNNGQLYFNGQPFTHVGVNAAYVLARRWYVDTDNQYIETLDALAGMGVKVIRCVAIPNASGASGGLGTWGTATGLSASFYAAMDPIYDYAATKGIKIIPTLFSNYWSVATYKSEKLNQLGVQASATRAYLRSCTTEYVTRYLNHDAIAGWEIGNEWNNWAELNAYPSGNDYTGNPYSADPNNLITVADLISAYVDIATTIRGIDSSRIIMSGNAGPWYTNRYGQDGYLYTIVRLNPDPIDTVSIHLYSMPDNNVWCRQGYEPMGDIVSIMKRASELTGKPAIFGEVGISENLATKDKDFVTLQNFLKSSEKPPLTLVWNFYKPDSTNPSNSPYDFYITGNRTKYADLIVEANKYGDSSGIQVSANIPNGWAVFDGASALTTPVPTFNSSFSLSYWVRYEGRRNDNFPRIFSATTDESNNGFVIIDLSSSGSPVDFSENYFRVFANAGGTSATLRSGHTYQTQWKHRAFVWKNWSATFTANTSTDSLILNGNFPDIQTGDLITMSTTGTLPSPLVPGGNYYAIKVGNNEVQLSALEVNDRDKAGGQAQAYMGTSMDLTTTGSGTHTITCRYLSVYENGLKTTSDTATNFPNNFVAPSSGNFVIGANRTASGDFFRGQLSNVSLWQRGLTELEVWNDYCGNSPPKNNNWLVSGFGNLSVVGTPVWTDGTRTVTNKTTKTTTEILNTLTINSIRGVVG